MDIRQLIYFLAIAEEGNISRAAEKLHIAQPPLSQQLKLLETELGIILMERSTRKINITNAGKLLQTRAKQIIDLMGKTVKELEDLKEGFQGTLSIGAIPSAGKMLLSYKIKNFHLKYPNVDFQIREGNTFEILELLKNGVVEIGIVRTPITQEVFEYINLPTEPMVAVALPHIFRNNFKEHIDISELKGMSLMMHNRYSNSIEESCIKAGFKPRIICKMDDTRILIEWANNGMGTAIVPRDVIEMVPKLNIEYREVNEDSLVTRIAVIWLKNVYLSTVTRNFIETFEV